MTVMEAKINLLTRITAYLTPGSRFIIIVLAMACAFYLALLPTPLAFLFAGVAVWLLWDYIRNNSVWGAFIAFRAGRLLEMRHQLDQVASTRWLSAHSTAYYHWLKGVSEVADGRYGSAQVFLLLAAGGALKSTNDRSLVQCLLAEVSLQLGQNEPAREHLKLAMALPHSEQVDRMIQQLAARI